MEWNEFSVVLRTLWKPLASKSHKWKHCEKGRGREEGRGGNIRDQVCSYNSTVIMCDYSRLPVSSSDQSLCHCPYWCTSRRSCPGEERGKVSTAIPPLHSSIQHTLDLGMKSFLHGSLLWSRTLACLWRRTRHSIYICRNFSADETKTSRGSIR